MKKFSFPTLLLIAASVSCTKPSPGLLELQRSRDAVRAAHSWQSDVSVQTPPRQVSIVRLEKVECPSRLDSWSTAHSWQPGGHEIWFDGIHYKMGAGGAWSASDVRLPANCGLGPALVGSGNLYDDLDAVAHEGEVRPGLPEPTHENAPPCTWWDVAAAKGDPPHYSVCVDETDHLPRTVRFHDRDLTFVYTLSNWNATSVALPADIAVPTN